MRRMFSTMSFIFCLVATCSAHAESLDLTKATVLVRAGDLPPAEKIASTILVEEVERRTGVRWKVVTECPEASIGPIIAISTVAHIPAWHAHFIPTASGPMPEKKAEAFAIGRLPTFGGPEKLLVRGHDPRGAMFGVGKLLRSLTWGKGQVSIESDFESSEAPDRPLRGHQIGYRDTANSWDAWTYDQFEQYFRDMVIFGANAVENIPFHDARLPRVMKYTRQEMNTKFGELCEKYDLDHWIWVPVEVRLPNDEKEAAFLKTQEAFYRSVKRLDAIFVPGGDPGNNKAIVLIPHLEKMAALARKYHPQTKVWLSLQHFKTDDVDLTFNYLIEKKPDWFGGLVMGPGSPPMEPTRQRLPKPYQLRWYPDITHVVRCQYPVAWLDPALGETLGREPVSPRPVDMTQIYQMDYTLTDGFLTYSDGVHDDFNKNLWTQLGWDPNRSPRDIAREYARFFFRSDLAELGADGLFGLENDMRGSLADNGTLGATFLLWQELERRVPKEAISWRFRMHLFRAYYDFYTRERLAYETQLERQALDHLRSPVGRDAKTVALQIKYSIEAARAILNRATTHPIQPELHAKLIAFGDELFRDIGLQTSVPKYDASGYERGAVLDFLDYPLNNQWWLEDQFDKIEKTSDHAEQRRQLDVVVNWENPGDHGYYDVIGHVGRSPRIVKLLMAGDAMRHETDIPMPTQRWVGEKKNVLRQAWHSYLDVIPSGITYSDLDQSAPYVVKLFAQRESPLVIDGVKAKLLKKGAQYDQVTEQIFEVPAEAVQDGAIKLTWETLPDEVNMNWRNRHYVTDIWVMKKPASFK